jgi:hypothetical protein
MTGPRGVLEYRRLRAPREDRSTLAIPPWNSAARLVRDHRAAWGPPRYDVQGRPLAQLAAEARQTLLTQALAYTRSYRDVNLPRAAETGSIPLVLAGHQPAMFHPGVWLKNFALGRLASAVGGLAVNLLIDSDEIKETAIRVPGGTLAAPRVGVIPFDAAGPFLTYEERGISDEALFASFGTRVAEQLRPLVPRAVVESYWPAVLERAADKLPLGQCLAQARHGIEGRWGGQNLELPFSRVCGSLPFYQFAVHLLAQLPRFHQAYNAALAEYRRVHRLRSAAQPVPDLASSKGDLEAPFWIWTGDDPRRRPLFVKAAGRQLILSDHQGWSAPLPVSADSHGAEAAIVLAELAAKGVKLRTRALTTTLYARLVLGDLFIHGIGGAKYDQVTDRLSETFFGVSPPPYVTLTGTLLLPLSLPAASLDKLRKVRHTLWELVHHPEKFIRWEELPAAAREPAIRAAACKQQYLAAAPAAATARARCRTIRAINAELQPYVEAQRQQLLAQEQLLASELAAQKLLSNREWAFCLYPEETLREFLLAIPSPEP